MQKSNVGGTRRAILHRIADPSRPVHRRRDSPAGMRRARAAIVRASRAAPGRHPREDPPMTRIRWIAAATATAAASALLLTAVATGPALAGTLFGDTFDDGDANGCTRSGGSWSVVTDGSPAYRQSGTGANAKALAGSTSWTD